MRDLVVRDLWECIEARDWSGVARFLHEDGVIDWPHSGKRIRGRENFVAIQREYPGGWHCRILSISAGPDRVAAEFRVDHEVETCFGIGFYEVVDGRLARGTEYWTTARSQDPLAWRSAWTERMDP